MQKALAKGNVYKYTVNIKELFRDNIHYAIMVGEARGDVTMEQTSTAKNLNAANIISASRFIFLPLLFVFVHYEMQTAFLIAYILIGATDFFDGIVARWFNLRTELGKKLDSFSDLFFYLASAWFLNLLYRPIIQSQPNISLIMTFLVLLILSFIISGIRLKKPMMLHTLILKFNAVVLYMLVIFSALFDTTYIVTLLALLYIIGMLESIAIFLLFDDVDPDAKSLIHMMKSSAGIDDSQGDEVCAED